MSSFSYAPGGPHYKHITTAATTLVKTGPAVFLGLSINTGGAGSTATIYDGVDNTGAVIAVIDTASRGQLLFGVPVTTGICVVTASGTPADVTVTYK